MSVVQAMGIQDKCWLAWRMNELDEQGDDKKHDRKSNVETQRSLVSRRARRSLGKHGSEVSTKVTSRRISFSIHFSIFAVVCLLQCG